VQDICFISLQSGRADVFSLHFKSELWKGNKFMKLLCTLMYCPQDCCWETVIGQQIYRLVCFELFAEFVSVLIADILRGLVVKSRKIKALSDWVCIYVYWLFALYVIVSSLVPTSELLLVHAGSFINDSFIEVYVTC